MKNAARVKRLVLPMITLLIFGLAIYALSRLLREIRPSDVINSLELVSWDAVALSILCTSGSYLMLTFYDKLAIHGIGRKLPYGHIAATSVTAFGISHTAGLGSISGGSIRYRSYATEGLTALEVAGIMTLVAINFFLGVGTLLGLSLTIGAKQASQALPLSVGATRTVGLALLAVIVSYLLFAYFKRKPIRVGGKRIEIPGLRLSLGQLVVSSMDLCFAASALYVLLPHDLGVSYLPFIGIYVIAVQAGVLSNVPGGLGVFESVLFLLLPGSPSDALLGGVLLYRLVYYVLPFSVALMLLTGREALHKHGHLRQLASWLQAHLRHRHKG